MNGRPDRLLLYRLGAALETSFERLVSAVNSGETDEPGRWWAEFVASAIDGVLLRELTSCDPAQPLLPFEKPHEVSAQVFSVAGGGMAGGPSVDILLQIWIDSSLARYGWGLPLVFRIIRGDAPVPGVLWAELKELAGQLCLYSNAARIVLIGHPNPFAFPPTAVIASTPLYAMPAMVVAGTAQPPRGVSGTQAHHLAYDIASGWIDDPHLGQSDAALSSFLKVFNVDTILRLRISQTS